MVHFSVEEALSWQRQVLRLEEAGKVTRTFRRLDPDKQFAVMGALLRDASEYGPHAVSIKRVATRAGVSVGSLYQYFGKRDGLLEFAAQACAGFLVESLDSYRPVMATMSLREGLMLYLSGGVEWSQAYSDMLSFFAKAAYQGIPGFADILVTPVSRSLRGLLSTLVESAQHRHELRPGLDIEMVTRLVHVMTLAVGDCLLIPYLNDYYMLTDSERQPAVMVEAAVDFIVSAIGSTHAMDGGGHAQCQRPD